MSTQCTILNGPSFSYHGRVCLRRSVYPRYITYSGCPCAPPVTLVPRADSTSRRCCSDEHSLWQRDHMPPNIEIPSPPFYRLKCVAFCRCCSSCLCLSERTGMHAYKKAHVCTNISFHQLTFHHFAVPTRLLSRRTFAGGGPLHDGCRRVTRRTTDKINASSFSSISACSAVFPSAAHSPKLC